MTADEQPHCSAGWAVVTGGNRGIGKEVCRQLLETGRCVMLCSRNAEAGKAAAAELAAASAQPVACRSWPCDTADSASIASLAAEVRTHYDQQVVALVNNAAVMPLGWTAKELQLALRTNVQGPVQLAQQLAPHMRPGGTIVQVSSTLGCLHELSPAYQAWVRQAPSLESLSGVPFRGNDRHMRNAAVPTYCLSKALLNRATQLLAGDPVLQQRQLSVNSVCPGHCRTEMGLHFGDRSAAQGAQSVLATLEQCLKAGQPPSGLFFRDGKRLDL